MALPPSKPRAFRVIGAVGLSDSREGAAQCHPLPWGVGRLPSLGWIYRLPCILPAFCVWLLLLPGKRKRTGLQDERGLLFGPGASRAAGPVRTSKPAQKTLSRGTWQSQCLRRRGEQASSHHLASPFVAACTTWGYGCFAFNPIGYSSQELLTGCRQEVGALGYERRAGCLCCFGSEFIRSFVGHGNSPLTSLCFSLVPSRPHLSLLFAELLCSRTLGALLTLYTVEFWGHH